MTDLHFQPIMHFPPGTGTPQLIQLEALTGDTSRLRGLDPLQLLQHDLDILRAACKQLADWICRDLCPADLKVSVNFLPEHFTYDQLVHFVTEALCQAGLPATQLVIEIAETSRLADTRHTRQTMSALRDLGLGFAIDDGGKDHHAKPWQVARVGKIVGKIAEIKLDHPMLGRTLVLELIQALGRPVRIVVEWVRSLSDLAWALSLSQAFPHHLVAVQGELVGLKCPATKLPTQLGWATS